MGGVGGGDSKSEGKGSERRNRCRNDNMKEEQKGKTQLNARVGNTQEKGGKASTKQKLRLG
jgi:hypothetical protein